MLPYPNLTNMFLAQAKKYRQRTALRVKINGTYHDVSWREFQETVIKVGLALRSLHFQKGDRIAILSENRPEWAFVDLGAIGIGVVDVPIYATSSSKEIAYVINHSKAKAIFISSHDLLEKVVSELVEMQSIQHMIVFDDVKQISEKLTSWQNFLKLGESQGKITFNDLNQLVSPNDLATIIYTSGTTGPPKGVMLTHENFLINCLDAAEAIELSDKDSSLSFLPLSHVFERMAGFYFPISVGCTIAYAENMTSVAQNMLEIRPTMACAVPRFYEKVYHRIMDAVEKSPKWKKNLIQWALRVGKQITPYRTRGQAGPFFLRLQFAIATILVFKKLKKGLGGRITQFISGGAALPRYLGEFFFSAGIMILEGYGLTETSPVISANQKNRIKFGTVGLPFRHVEVRLAETGEICIRGPSLMKGYYQNEEATKAVVRDGWFYTGDIGTIDEEGYLSITDRMKDIIVTSGGKNIAPQNIENTIAKSAAIQQAIVIGEGRNYLVALIVPDFEYVTEKCQLGKCTREEFVRSKKVRQLIQSEIEELTADFSSYEQIKYFRLVPHELTQERGEVTPTLKIKRKVIRVRYVTLIDEMYAEGEAHKRS